MATQVCSKQVSFQDFRCLIVEIAVSLIAAKSFLIADGQEYDVNNSIRGGNVSNFSSLEPIAGLQSVDWYLRHWIEFDHFSEPNSRNKRLNLSDM